MQGPGVKLEKPPVKKEEVPMPVSEEITKGRLEVTVVEKGTPKYDQTIKEISSLVKGFHEVLNK
jgi:hypothetical protein